MIPGARVGERAGSRGVDVLEFIQDGKISQFWKRCRDESEFQQHIMKVMSGGGLYSLSGKGHFPLLDIS